MLCSLLGALMSHLSKIQKIAGRIDALTHIHASSISELYFLLNGFSLFLVAFRYRFRKYKSVFRGDQLVDWLLQVGLASDRQAAVYSGNCLILGRVIRHVTQAHFFLDSPYLYEFHSRRGSSFSALGEVSEES